METRRQNIRDDVCLGALPIDLDQLTRMDLHFQARRVDADPGSGILYKQAVFAFSRISDYASNVDGVGKFGLRGRQLSDLLNARENRKGGRGNICPTACGCGRQRQEHKQDRNVR